MKKVILSMMLTFLMVNVFANNGIAVILPLTQSDSPTIESLDETNAKVYIFESGTQSVGYKCFMRVEIHNDYGIGVEANGETCFLGSKKTIFKDNVVLKIDGAFIPKVYWDVESSVLKLYVTK